MDNKEAIKIIKDCGYIGNEVGVAFDVAIKSMDKLDKIEQIIADYGITLEIINHADDGDFSDFEIDIVREVLENG